MGIVTQLIIFGVFFELSIITDGFCIFGNKPNCLLPCHCQNSDCLNNQPVMNCQCEIDPVLEANNPDGGLYWGGEACQTGNIAKGKHAEQPYTYYNSGFKINATADRALDGNISSYAYSRASASSIAYWLVDLNVLHVIERAFIIANNLGNSLISLENYTVYVGNTTDVFSHTLCGRAPSPLKATQSSSAKWNWNTITCERHLVGRYVSVRKSAEDTVKHWLPIHEIAVIGYAVSNVKLGYCLQYENTSSPSDLLNLRCLQCVGDRILPDCETSTPLMSSSSSHMTTKPSYATIHSTTDKNIKSSALPTTIPTALPTPTSTLNMKSHFTTITPPIVDGNQPLSTDLIIVIAIFGAFTLSSFIIISILCLKLRRRNEKNKETKSNASNKGRVNPDQNYAPSKDVFVDDNYTNLSNKHETLPTVYLAINSDQESQRATHTALNNQPGEQTSTFSNRDIVKREDSDGYTVPIKTFTSDKDDYEDAETVIYSTIDD